MKKRFLLIIFTCILFFCFSQTTSARQLYVCKYGNDDYTAVIRLRMDTKNGKSTIDQGAIAGDEFEGKTFTVTGTQEVWNSANGIFTEIKNWQKGYYSSTFTGHDYYIENDYQCPPYLYFFRAKYRDKIFTSANLRVFVSDQEYDEALVKEIKRKFRVNSDDKIKVLKNRVATVVEEDFTKNPVSCMDFPKVGNPNAVTIARQQSCETNSYFACIWVETNANPAGGYCNVDNLQYVKCGDAFDIPHQVPQIISFAVNFLKIVTPIVLIIVSIIKLLKALASSNEDEIKKSQKSLIKNVIAAAMVFFIISIVQFVILKVADNSTVNLKGETETGNLSNCLSCMLNNDCDDSIYYKTNVGGEYFCTGVNGDEIECGEAEFQQELTK